MGVQWKVTVLGRKRCLMPSTDGWVFLQLNMHCTLYTYAYAKLKPEYVHLSCTSKHIFIMDLYMYMYTTAMFTEHLEPIFMFLVKYLLGLARWTAGPLCSHRWGRCGGAWGRGHMRSLQSPPDCCRLHQHTQTHQHVILLDICFFARVKCYKRVLKHHREIAMAWQGILSRLSSSRDPGGGCWGPGGEAVRASTFDELHNVPQTGLQRRNPPTLTLAHIHGGSQLAWPWCCPVRMARQ